MTEQNIFYLLLGILTIDFVLERVLQFLNQKSAKQPIPAELSDIYDKEQYAKSQAYQGEISKYANLSTSVSFILTSLAIIFGWFGLLDGWIRSFSQNDLVTTLLFFGILYLISDITSLPFSIHRIFGIEEKYGFNRTTPKIFILDKIKGYMISFILGGLILWILLYPINSIGQAFWIYFWVILTAFTLLANMFYTSLILPLFNKLKPLEEGELKNSIHQYSQKVDFPLKNIFVMDGSKRSGKGNAFFSGIGKRKKVVLFDTLIEKHTTEELTAVFAHEVGHFKKKHILSSTIIGIMITGFMLYLFSLMAFSPNVSFALGGKTFALHLNMLAFGILYTPISRIIGTLGNTISRKNEYEADAYAKKTYRADSLIDGLKKLSGDQLSNLTPHPAYVFVHYSHPPLRERIKALNY